MASFKYASKPYSSNYYWVIWSKKMESKISCKWLSNLIEHCLINFTL